MRNRSYGICVSATKFHRQNDPEHRVTLITSNQCQRQHQHQHQPPQYDEGMNIAAGMIGNDGSSKKRQLEATATATTTPSYIISHDATNEIKKSRPGCGVEYEWKKNSKIWLNHKLVVRPSYATSYGILFYRQQSGGFGNESNFDNVRASREFEYLLGLIPQGNAWTVFKGVPEINERPEETAVREFEEESSLPFPYEREEWGKSSRCPVTATLYGVTSTKKLLEIYLLPAPPVLDVSRFDVNKVVKIDGSGRFAGLPEIVEIRFLTRAQATEGVRGKGSDKIAKIYKSQISILERADWILNSNTMK